MKPKRKAPKGNNGLPRFLSTETAAKLLELAPITLMRWRKSGQGPPFIRISHSCVRYALSDLLAFLEARKQPGEIPQEDSTHAPHLPSQRR